MQQQQGSRAAAAMATQFAQQHEQQHQQLQQYAQQLQSSHIYDQPRAAGGEGGGLPRAASHGANLAAAASDGGSPQRQMPMWGCTS
jgi:hypothetical protein